ncbi:MAG: cytochrome C [Deltaproteobacteria bacterium]|nr:cytochrome C [Deltaproteobacteria bacterium]MBN2670811.1 cytochrome C [Deltaproteobacteria bacterium]
MNYPIWELPTIGGGSLVALIAVLHVYISHLAVGGGAFIWLTDIKAVKDNDNQLLLYVKKHTWFFLLLTMVFGGVSGVGIWFIIALVNPAATSTLIHSFVFGWAIEWVFFVGEIAALLLYHYNFDKLDDSSRHKLAFFYFLFAWLSLFIINGILAFMLSPGKWVSTHNFWHGFFNPTYFSQLFFRTAAMGMIAGLFGYVTAIFTKEQALRMSLIRYCSKWLLLSIPAMVVFGVWYFYSLPDAARAAITDNAQMQRPIQVLIVSTGVIFFFGAVLILRLPRTLQATVTGLLIGIGLSWMGGFEYSREVARKPYVLADVMYSTSVMKSDEQKINEKGVLKSAKWTEVRCTANEIAAGREMFNIQCLACHTVNGVRNDVVEKLKDYPYMGILSLLEGQGKFATYMPKVLGTPKEKASLALYITEKLLKKKAVRAPEPYSPKQPLNADIPPFNRDTDAYVLLAWNDLGMHCISDSDQWFVILPPANTLEAQLIKRGLSPEVITEDVVLTYDVEKGFANPSAHSEFWKYAKETFGAVFKKNVGVAGKGVSGTFDPDDNGISFLAKAIPVVPYTDNGSFNPYPLFTVTAKRKSTGEVLAVTRVVAPTSTEMGCRNCHGGPWAVNNAAGVHSDTAEQILRTHDRLSGTTLHTDAVNGHPKLCQSCHGDPALGAEGNKQQLKLSTAIHGWHANFMYLKNSSACAMCHPAGSEGSTRCLRGLHATVGLGCIDCHGTLDEHALSLLKGEPKKPQAKKLAEQLTPTQVATAADVNPRQPWLNEPDCETCHADYQAPEKGASGFNTWVKGPADLYRNRTGDEGSVRCTACHGSPHALYPASNHMGKNRDNLIPLQLSDTPFPIGSQMDCAVCHTDAMEDSVHHPNMERAVRNKKIRQQE